MSIRLSNADDYAALLALNDECYPNDRGDLSLPPRLLKVVRKGVGWVYEDDGIKACLLSEISESQPYIWSIATAPSHRGRGVATMLLDKFEKYYTAGDYSRLWLHVRVDNPAQKIYFDAGYRTASFERNLYGMNEHGMVMRKRIR